MIVIIGGKLCKCEGEWMCDLSVGVVLLKSECVDNYKRRVDVEIIFSIIFDAQKLSECVSGFNI